MTQPSFSKKFAGYQVPEGLLASTQQAGNSQDYSATPAIPTYDTTDVKYIYEGARGRASTLVRSETVKELGAKTVSWESSASSVFSILFTTPELDNVQSIVRDFESLEDGWDGLNSVAPKAGTIEDTLAVLQHWPRNLVMPEPAVGVDGNVVLELFDSDGFSLGVVEFVGENKAIFTAIDKITTLTSGSFDTLSPTSILAAISALKRALV